MTWWNLGGLNPQYKEFVEKYPDKTMLGMAWSMQWRLMLLILAIEMIFFIPMMMLGGIMAFSVLESDRSHELPPGTMNSNGSTAQP